MDEGVIHLEVRKMFHFSAVLSPRETYIREVVPNIQGVPNPFYDYYRQREPRASEE